MIKIDSNKCNDTDGTISHISSSEIEKIGEILNKVECFDFNVFELDELASRKTLYYVSSEIFNLSLYFEDMINEEVFKNFIEEITKGYYRDNVKYHNDLHATDVLQTVYTMVERGDLYYRCKLEELDIMSLLLSAIVICI